MINAIFSLLFVAGEFEGACKVVIVVFRRIEIRK